MDLVLARVLRRQSLDVVVVVGAHVLASGYELVHGLREGDVAVLLQELEGSAERGQDLDGGDALFGQDALVVEVAHDFDQLVFSQDY